MTSIGPLSATTVKQLDTLGLKAVKLSDEEIQKIKDLWSTEISKPAAKSDNDIHGDAKKDEDSAFLSSGTQATRDAGAKTKVDTQILGQTDGDAAVSKFLDFMSKTPEQRWHEQWLKSHGLTEEEFAALPADEKQALIDQMTEEMKQKLEQEAKEKTKEATLA